MRKMQSQTTLKFLISGTARVTKIQGFGKNVLLRRVPGLKKKKQLEFGENVIESVTL